MIIGICGGSGSGKTTLLREIANEYVELKPTVFSLDNYYKPITEQIIDENDQHNFDLPSALNRELAFGDLRNLKNGKPIEVKEYFFNAPPNKHVLITLQPSRLIIVEGLFVFHYKELLDLMDYSIFMEVNLDTQLDRRLYRDEETRGYSREAILYQWNNHVVPCYDKYLAPYKKNADFSFENDSNFDSEFIRLKNEIDHRLK
jgi:uridine kinase